MTTVVGGGQHRCALLTTGAVKCWGYNGVGQLGDGTTTSRTSPVDVQGLGGTVVSITATNMVSCAVLSSGTVKCWGWNDYGQLGDGTTTNRNTPVAITGFYA